MKISILIPVHDAAAARQHPASAGSAGSVASARELCHADQLAAAMRGALGVDVPILEGSLADAPATGYLLAFAVPSTVDPALARRIVAFDEDRSGIVQRIEQQGFAAAVEKHRYFQWYSQPDSDRGSGLIGRKDIAARMPARIANGPFTGAQYGAIASETARDLPALIAAYLMAYDAAAQAP
jgi:hypothetical protein